MMTEANKSFLNKILKSLSLLLVILCLVRAWNYGQANVGFDFYQFWAVGQKITQENKINIYSYDFRRSLGLELWKKTHNSKSHRFFLAANYRKTLETYSTPFLYSLFGIFSSIDYDRAYTIYQFFCMSCMVFSILMLGNLLRFPFVISMLFLAFFTSYFEPYHSDLNVSNVNQIQLALLVLFLWFQSRHDWKIHHFLGGFVLGSLIMFKPNLIFVPVMLSVSWLINRQFKKMILEYAGIAVSVMTAVIFSSVIFGSMQCWFDWLKAGVSIPLGITTVMMGNFSFVRLILDWYGIDMAKFLTIALISITFLFIWIGRQRESGDGRRGLNGDFLEDVPMAGAGCLIYLLSASLVWLHYYILVIPSAFFVLRSIFYFKPLINRPDKIISRSLAILSILLLSLTPVETLFGMGVSCYQRPIEIIAGTFLLFILTMKEFNAT